MSSAQKTVGGSAAGAGMDLLGVAPEAMESISDIRRWANVRCPSIVDTKSSEVYLHTGGETFLSS